MAKINKKGYYFSIEATLGILILATSFMMFVYFTESAVPIPDYRYARNIAGYLSSVKLGELCEKDGCEGLSIANIGEKNFTLLEVIGLEYSKSGINVSNITSEIFIKSSLLLRGKNVALLMRAIGCDVIFSTKETSCEEGSSNQTTEVSYRKVINGYELNPETGDLNFWGDYLFEVRVW